MDARNWADGLEDKLDAYHSEQLLLAKKIGYVKQFMQLGDVANGA